ncbi:Probable Co/Zn/Cd efflux system membrane fusion protein [hydrothermal vent metagenome]|uniref:Probable Co/Zn/Cd efflux system membrane fusion protein n=1 Tax=hydrothermal vent metagenome TaxID=652676 RepID=A0A3B1BX13_9ZZZZ
MSKFFIAIVMLAAGAGGGYWYATQQPSNASAVVTEVERLLAAVTGGVIPADTGDESDASAAGGTGEREVLFWRNPMNPAITSPVFTQDSMGMDYLPVYADDGGDSDEPAGTVKIDPVTVQNIGVRTARAEQRSLARHLNALGQVDFNEERLARLHPKTSGWIEQLRVDETGVRVSKGTILLALYSPDLVSAQREYLVALENWESVRNSSVDRMKKSTKSLLRSSRERLELFDVPAHQIKELEQSRKIKKQLHIHSPFAGRIMHIGAREGQYITPKDELYLIADLGRIWVNVDVYEDDLPWMKIGDRAEMTVRAAPGRLFEGKITFIHPTMQKKSRTVRVRLEFDNPDLLLKPGMFANVVLHTDAQPNAVVVPSEAIVRSGTHEQVFVVRAPGKFEPRRVTLGVSADGFTQILEGVKAGEEVVTSSQFLIDSESKLREATAKMMAAMAAESAVEEIDMSDMDMGDMDMENNP